MAAILSLVLSAVAAAYLLPKALGLGWAFTMTWVGKYFLTWAVIAVAYDWTMNNQEAEAFDAGDVLVTGGLTFAARFVSNKVL